jgi:hypothetical protein
MKSMETADFALEDVAVAETSNMNYKSDSVAR